MTDDVQGDAETKSTRTRWRFTGTTAANLLLVTLCAAILVYVATGQDVPLWASGTFGLSVLGAVAWTFGPKALKTAANAGGKQ